MLGKLRRRNWLPMFRKRMTRRSDHDQANAEQSLQLQLRRRNGQRSHDAKRAMALENRANDCAERFDVEPQGRVWKLCLEIGDRACENLDWKHDVDCDAKLRLQAAGQIFGDRFELIHTP